MFRNAYYTDLYYFRSTLPSLKGQFPQMIKYFHCECRGFEKNCFLDLPPLIQQLRKPWGASQEFSKSKKILRSFWLYVWNWIKKPLSFMCKVKNIWGEHTARQKMDMTVVLNNLLTHNRCVLCLVWLTNQNYWRRQNKTFFMCVHS